MGLLEFIRQFLTAGDQENQPACPGCGRPVASRGDVCADCSPDQTQKPGG